MVVLLRLLIINVQTAMLLSKLIVLIAVLNHTGQSFAWLPNKLRPLQILLGSLLHCCPISLDHCRYLMLLKYTYSSAKRKNFCQKIRCPAQNSWKKPTAKEQILWVVFLIVNSLLRLDSCRPINQWPNTSSTLEDSQKRWQQHIIKKKNTITMVPPGRRLPAAPILRVKAIAVCRAININTRNTAIQFFMWT